LTRRPEFIEKIKSSIIGPIVVLLINIRLVIVGDSRQALRKQRTFHGTLIACSHSSIPQERIITDSTFIKILRYRKPRRIPLSESSL
jgi:hypothetical protein